MKIRIKKIKKDNKNYFVIQEKSFGFWSNLKLDDYRDITGTYSEKLIFNNYQEANKKMIELEKDEEFQKIDYPQHIFNILFIIGVVFFIIVGFDLF